MSSYINDIIGALDYHLSLLPGAPSIAYEELEFSEQSDSTYLRPTLLPAGAVQLTNGDSGRDLYNGIYQVDIFEPKRKSRSTLADDICDHFKRGTYLPNGSTTVRITSAFVERKLIGDILRQTPVTIAWTVFSNARS